MVPIQRETLINLGILVCIVAACFTFREISSMKDQLNHVTMMNQRLTHHANQINQAMMLPREKNPTTTKTKTKKR